MISGVGWGIEWHAVCDMIALSGFQCYPMKLCSNVLVVGVVAEWGAELDWVEDDDVVIWWAGDQVQ